MPVISDSCQSPPQQNKKHQFQSILNSCIVHIERFHFDFFKGIAKKNALKNARNQVIKIPEPVGIHAFDWNNIRTACNIFRTLDNKFLSCLIWS